MSQPNFFSGLSLDPLVLSGLAVLSAQALYYVLFWFIGSRHQKEAAVEGFERILISGVLFGVALALVYLSLWGLGIYLDLVGAKLPDNNSAVRIIEQAKGWQDFGDKMQTALRVAEQTYRSYVSASVEILKTYAGVVIATGIPPWTAPISMAVMNVYSFLVMAATTVILSAAVYAIAAAMARAWVFLLPLGAVLVTYERTRHLGAWLLAAAVVAPIVLVAGADVLLASVNPADVAKAAGAVTPLVAFTFQHVDDVLKAMLMLGLIGLTMGVVTYAVSRIFDHAGASLSLE
jgi:hypothetical protein